MSQTFHHCLLSKRYLLLVFVALLYVAQNQVKAQGCNPDTIPPVAVCPEKVTVKILDDASDDCYGSAGPNNQPAAFDPYRGRGVAWLKATSLDQGSYDACGANLHFTVQREAPYSSDIYALNTTNGQFPCDDAFPDFPSEFERAISEQDSVKFYADEVGDIVYVRLRVYQLTPGGQIATYPSTGAPIVSPCIVEVNFTDKTKPQCIAPANVTVSCEQFDPSLVAYGQPNITDNCCIDSVSTLVNYSQFDTLCTKGTIVRTFKAYDCQSNTNQCSQTIVVNYSQNYFVRFPNDVIIAAPDPGGNYGTPTFFMEDCELMGISFNDEIYVNQPDAAVRIERTWSVINWCTYDPGLPWIAIPNPSPNAITNHASNLPGPIVSAPGTQAPWKSTIVKINPTDPTPTDFSTFWQQDANGYQYQQIIRINDTFFVAINGNVFADSTENCVKDAGEGALAGWTVTAVGLETNQEYSAVTDGDGNYNLLMSGLDTLASVTLDAPSNFGQNCQTSYIVHGVLGQSVVQDIPVHLEHRCALLSVGMGTPRLRRCFENVYSVQACNPSAEQVSNTTVDVELDHYLNYVTSSIPGTFVSGNTYRFATGTLEAGECKSFTINVAVSCDAPLGYTHCSEARIAPFDDCRSNSLWSGADVEVTATCDGDSVRMNIQNVGTGDMAEKLNYVVVEDIIMRQTGEFQLTSGATRTLAFPANGSTWRIQAEQEPLHPFGGLQAVALEGCGGFNTPGLVNQFALGDPNPFEASDCQQNIGSFDPNDKQAFPVGFGPNHLLDANTDIEYMIRFQNTGTDTAFNIVVVDTLSTFLDPATVRVLTASHPMEFAKLEGNVIKFVFSDILLVDSTTNNPASNGFVKFRVAQKQNNADGILIENRAAIYFDFNDPIFTNTTFHTIGHPELSVGIHELTPSGLKVYPNPTADAAVFQFEEALRNARFELKNQMGQVLRTANFNGNIFRFERAGLAPGIYFFDIRRDGGHNFSGKIMVK